jgi:D-tyrosyl-tRNA(Tyr) deacylase
MIGCATTLTEMRALVQRVTSARVTVDGRVCGHIGTGLLVLLGIGSGDTSEDLEWLCGKVARLRLFPDAEGVMNRDVCEANGDVLLVSQFTLYASTVKGNRPSYIRAARPGEAQPLYLRAKTLLEALLGRPVATGEFGADMQVHLVNDGPVTIMIDSRSRE